MTDRTPTSQHLQFFRKLAKHPSRLAYVSFGLALLLIYITTFYYLPNFEGHYYGFYVYLGSLLLLALAGKILPPIHTSAERDPMLTIATIRFQWLGIAVISIVLLMMINIPVGKMTDLHLLLGMDAVPTVIQAGLLGLAIIGLAHGFGARMLPRRFVWQRQHTILLGIVVIGGLVRLWDIENTYHLYLDEILFMGDVYYIHTENLPFLFPNYAPTTDAYTFLQSIMVTLLGPGIVSQRLVSVCGGIAGLVVIYTFARQLFSVRVALMSALLYATLPVYVQYGRIGLYNVFDSIWGVIGFVYILRGMRSGRVADYALAGIAFGITHYFYEGGRLFFTAFLVCWLIWSHMVTRRDDMFRQMAWRHLFALAFCALVLIIPVYHTMWQFDHPMTQRLLAEQTSTPFIVERIESFLLGHEVAYLGVPVQPSLGLSCVSCCFASLVSAHFFMRVYFFSPS